MRRSFLRIVSLAGLGVFLIQFAFADPNSSLEQGIRHFQRENNDEAASLLKKAREEDPASSRAAFYLGMTLKRLQRYDEAKKHLADAVTLTPKVKEALHELIEVEYQLGDFEEAKRWITTAEQEGMRPAQTAFLKGLVLSKEGKGAESVEAFKKAKELDPALAQSVDYQIGMTHLKEKSFDEAEEAFKEVIVLDPNTDIGAYASEYLRAIERRRDQLLLETGCRLTRDARYPASPDQISADQESIELAELEHRTRGRPASQKPL